MDRHASYYRVFEATDSRDGKTAVRTPKIELPLYWCGGRLPAERLACRDRRMVGANGNRPVIGVRRRNHVAARHGIYARKMRAEINPVHGVRAAGGGVAGGSEPGNCRRRKEWLPRFV